MQQNDIVEEGYDNRVSGIWNLRTTDTEEMRDG
jgi:hypothetical protein